MLTGKQKRYLRGLGHSLKPTIMVGKGEVTDALLKETDGALAAHELVKVKILESCLLGRNEVAEELAAACSAEVAQILGRTVLLYRRGEKPEIELPSEKRKK
jgi:RNA-binding protein